MRSVSYKIQFAFASQAVTKRLAEINGQTANKVKNNICLKIPTSVLRRFPLDKLRKSM